MQCRLLPLVTATKENYHIWITESCQGASCGYKTNQYLSLNMREKHCRVQQLL